MNKKYNWYKIADTLSDINLSDKRLAEFVINEKKVCLALFNDTLSSFSAKCPHAGGNLNNGYLDATGNIVCPLHGYKFNIQSGRNSSGEGYYLKTYHIESRLDGIFIKFEENNSEILNNN